jgi:acyl-CoA synthetase (AMP-forming)/AMP-acid ligase II
MKLIEKLTEIWKEIDYPFLIHRGQEIKFSHILKERPVDLDGVRRGDVVAVIGDFDLPSIQSLLHLVDMGVMIVPLTTETTLDHEYFFDSALVDGVIRDGHFTRRPHNGRHELIETLRRQQHAGLIVFSTGTTGRPKAILHDLALVLKRFETPRPTLRTINFLLFDHMGGLNTLLHTLFNKGVVVSPEARTVQSVLDTCRQHDVELLPTTPTFLRLMLMSGAVPDKIPECLKVITYGTERMDQPTLDELCGLLPNIDFRQTFGMSELGVLRVKSEARDSLFMKVGGEGVETRVLDRVLQIRSQSRMLGYLNAPSPFDSEGWYNTNDVVETRDDYVKVVGRVNDVINVGGLKFMPSEVEYVALEYPGVSLVKAVAKSNPITGQHVELTVQPTQEGAVDRGGLAAFLKERLQPHMLPRRIHVEAVSIGHRFKKS